jgi:SAM-dependent methyltransferase
MDMIITRGKNFIRRKVWGQKALEMQKEHVCPVCNNPTDFEPFPLFYLEHLQLHKFIHNIFLSETLNFRHFYCKTCGALDRCRLYALYLAEYLKDKPSIRLLDVAPSPALRSFLESQPNIIYRCTDLYRTDVDDNADLTNMTCYEDASFDFFICSHVLEHVSDDRKAMSELYRVLKKGGQGILMVPINIGVERTLEDPECVDIPTRWRLFGQDDHLRMYNKEDYLARLEAAGFKISLLGEEYFGAEVFKKAAINSNSLLYIVSK